VPAKSCINRSKRRSSTTDRNSPPLGTYYEGEKAFTSMRNHGRHIAFVVLLLCPTTLLRGQTSSHGEGSLREVGRTTERELNVVLSAPFGNVSISRGESEKILTVHASRKDNRQAKMSMEYEVRNRVGYADVTLGQGDQEEKGQKRWFDVQGLEGNNWDLQFTDAIPVSFDIELGIGKGAFDLSGLRVKDFNLSAGASTVEISFVQPNTSSLDNMNIESGVGTFTGRKLGNANFRHLRFQGGLGACTLDFSGALRNEVDVDVEVGLGLLSIVIPQDIGAKIFYEKNWISRLDADNDFRYTADNEYLSENYDSAPGKMNIRIQSGLGSVKVKRR
jgi:hypothetical protein